ncbi:17503_t:CDS:1 [Acaulospora colombiana]|uniref:17503_t:CDS:1 n=1 Tax=Acaulospora colombiana TaxID=27376 RepID=A0ACA9K8A9_9GLOM|nr:17503_t:CDS:1 [Acaulospora colombiana]
MPKVKSRLTSREEKCLIDIDLISPERHDFALMLLCSRILYRCQLKCFQHTRLSVSDVRDIVQCEVDKLPELLSAIGASLEANGSMSSVNHHENLMVLDFRNQLLNSAFPLDVIKNLLVAEQSSRSMRSQHEKNVRKLYRNLVNMTEDLKKFMHTSPPASSANANNNSSAQSRKRFQFRPIFFVNRHLLSTEGISDDGEEFFINPPKPVLWLPVLTNKERITQRTTSAFSLRKKTEFTKNNGPSFRPQLLRMNFVQTFGSRQNQPQQQRRQANAASQRRNNGRSPSSNDRCHVTSMRPQQCRLSNATSTAAIDNSTYGNEEYQGKAQAKTVSSPSSFVPVTSIGAIICHEDIHKVNSDNSPATHHSHSPQSTRNNINSQSSLMHPQIIKPTPKRLPFPINTDPNILIHPKSTTSLDVPITPPLPPSTSQSMASAAPSSSRICNCSPLSFTHDFRKLCPCVMNQSNGGQHKNQYTMPQIQTPPLATPPLFKWDLEYKGGRRDSLAMDHASPRSSEDANIRSNTSPSSISSFPSISLSSFSLSSPSHSLSPPTANSYFHILPSPIIREGFGDSSQMNPDNNAPSSTFRQNPIY